MRARACNLKTSNAAIFSVGSGRRFYNPELGRWINRDSIGEDGGAHVYCCCNCAVNGLPIHVVWGIEKDTDSPVSSCTLTMKN